jgi:protein-L-isoaspartate(D-aspartate) O-methyltransferase
MRRRPFVGVSIALGLLPSLLCAAAPCNCGAPVPAAPAIDFRQAAHAMVVQQLQARGIRDPRVLAAMASLPRERFVPAERQAQAYEDRPLPIGHGQTISQPYIVALMSEALALGGTEKVLEIGTGSGYQAALLCSLAREVYSIEIVEPLAVQARQVLNAFNYANLRLRVGDGYRGWPEAAPFDAILLTAAPDHVPQPLLDQLAVGGRLLLPIGKLAADGSGQALRLITRSAQGWEERRLRTVRFVPMTGEAQRPDPGLRMPAPARGGSVPATADTPD